MPGLSIPHTKNFGAKSPGTVRSGAKYRGLQKGRMGERAYAYAKACGIIGKSFVGKRIKILENVNRLSELDRMVFPEAPQNLPEKELLVKLEDRIIDRAVDSIISIVDCFSRPPEFLSLLIRSYEYTDLKNALISFLDNDKSAPSHTDIGHFQTVHFEKWPDVRGMIEGTEFSFLLDINKILKEKQETMSLQSAMDRHYYSALWESLLSLPGKDRYAAEKILSAEISLRNAGWALRLRTYYEMPNDKVKRHLIDIPLGNEKSRKTAKPRTLAEEALECLEFPLDNYASWSSWHWKEFLNPDTTGRFWQVDPRHFQNAASRYLAHLARRYFRLNPFSMDSIFCFIKLKQFEEDILTSSVEGLGMGMSGRDIVSMLGVEL